MVRALWLLLAACAASPPEADPPLAGDDDLAPPIGDSAAEVWGLTVVAGLGRQFSPIADGDVLPLERGPQGLQHVELSVRADVPEGFHELGLALIRERDGETVSSAYRVGVPFQAGASLSEVLGLLLVVPVPTEALDEALRLEVEVVGPADRGRVVHPVTVEWLE